jgi:putative ABC transport system ATP-binding protein
MSRDHIAIDVQDVVKTYEEGRIHALTGATFQVCEGEFVAITGPSGCGKSTLLHLIGALDKPDSGRIVVNGTDLAHMRDLSRYRAREVGLVFQLHNLLPTLSASANVQLPMYEAQLSFWERRAKAQRLLEAVDLGDRGDTPPIKLSGVSVSGWLSLVPLLTIRLSYWPTSPQATWTPRPARWCWTCCAASSKNGV